VACAAVVLAAALSAAPAAGAQTTFRQTVVVTGSARPVELGRVTRTLTVITRDQIDALPARTVADVLRLQASIDVRARGVRGVQTDFAVRGAHFGQVLVLVDGVRLNDAQSGHHNGDIPVPLEAVERIEVLSGPGSSLFGADAVGGTINVVTRRDAGAPAVLVQGGSFGLAAASASAGLGTDRIRQTVAVSVDRSSGFIDERDFSTRAVRARTSFGDRTGVSVSYLWKEFGALNFYGPSPSREWTNQTLVAADHAFAAWAGWSVSGQASYRTHGDRFVWNRFDPAISDNRHRTHAVLAGGSGSRRVGQAQVTLGAEAGGDWIRSSNLGDHAVSRVSGYGEWRQALGDAADVDAALRVDRYDEYGTSWSPSFGVGWWATPAVRLRASVGRAFRAPTFTERYYSDPAHLARAEIGPERAWAGEGGVDVLAPGNVVLRATVFGRADRDVIDWLRATTADRWRTFNIHRVGTVGVELGVRRTFASGAFVQAQYTAIDLDAAEVTQLSKSVLDYAPHSVTVSGSVGLPGRLRVAPRVEYRHRTRSSGESDHALVDLRLGRRFGEQFELLVDGTNLLDADYQEIAGVAMPGAAVAVSLAIRGR
jgi:iron complex outermembrane receptor protein